MWWARLVEPVFVSRSSPHWSEGCTTGKNSARRRLLVKSRSRERELATRPIEDEQKSMPFQCSQRNVRDSPSRGSPSIDRSTFPIARTNLNGTARGRDAVTVDSACSRTSVVSVRCSPVKPEWKRHRVRSRRSDTKGERAWRGRQFRSVLPRPQPNLGPSCRSTHLRRSRTYETKLQVCVGAPGTASVASDEGPHLGRTGQSGSKAPHLTLLTTVRPGTELADGERTRRRPG